MNYYFEQDCYLYLDRFTNQFIYTASGVVAQITLPLEVTIVDTDCVLYENGSESMIDYSPTTLGYYWINDNQCIRSKEGLVFEPTQCEDEAVQYKLVNGELSGEKINWVLSKKPAEEPHYFFCALTGKNAIINKDALDEYTLEINGVKHPIWLPELDLSYVVKQETGFNREDNQIDYYGRKLPALAIDSFKVLGLNYAKDAYSVYCGDEQIKAADVNTFEVITMTLAKDKNNVYSFGEIIKSADASTFEIIDGKNHNAFEQYEKDKNAIYYLSKPILGVDLASFQIVCGEYSIDKNWVYRSGVRIPSLDVNSFEFISGSYVKDKNGIYTTGLYIHFITESCDDFIDFGYEYFSCNKGVYRQDCTQKLDVSISSFESIDYNWAKSDTCLFYQSKLVYEGDCTNVKLIDELIVTANENVITNKGLIKGALASQWELLGSGFYRSGNQLYYREELIESGNPNTFEELDEWRCKDKNNVYIIDMHFYVLEIISDINTGDVEIIDESFIKTKSAVYFYEEEIIGADPSSFMALEHGFSRDKNTVFNREDRLVALDPNNVTIINPHIIHDLNNIYYDNTLLDININKLEQVSEDILKDDKNVYYKNQLITGACASTYEKVNHFFQKDSNSVYHNNRRLSLNASQTCFKESAFAFDCERAYFINEPIVGVDIASFEIVEDSISKDKNHVYYRDKIIDKADPATFKVMGYSQFTDKNHIFKMLNGHAHPLL